jgi:asparagine synthase (glutamine-hydrolysing)
MCGITGVININQEPATKELLKKMTDTLTHRGPDDEGYYLSKNAGFGFRRLSIIDMKSGHQPIHNEDNTVWSMHNGEIYNFRELRKELESDGHKFYTNSDSETIVHAYEKYGLDFVRHIDGMFALAVWDEKNETLVLARDRMGKKPLHYCSVSGKFIFGSEIKALLAHPDCPRELDFLSLAKYLHFEYVPAPSTIFKSIRKLRPAELLVLRNGASTTKKYWDLPYDKPRLDISLDDAATQLRGLLSKAVKKRLVADVPLGIFLSGGVDSSTLTALMAEISGQKVKSFNISFTEQKFDESRDAKFVADLLGTEHYCDRFSPETLIDALPQVFEFLDEPMADPSILPTYLLSMFTRKRVTVALGGDGGDELFGGYPTYLAHKYYYNYARLPGFVRNAARAVINGLPVSSSYFSLDFKLKRFLRGEDRPLPERHMRWMSAFLPEEIAGVFNKATNSALDKTLIYDELDSVRGKTVADPLDLAMYIDSKMYLQDDILVKVDRASMGVSLEVRAPFLDTEIVEFAARLPTSMKLMPKTGGYETKYLLKKAMENTLPRRVLKKKKQGFTVPLAKWFRKELTPLLESYLNEARIEKEGIFDPSYVRRLIDDHRSGRSDNRKPLWTLLVFELWKEKYLS